MKGPAEKLMPGSLVLSSRSWMKQTAFRYSILLKRGFARHQAVFVLQSSCAFSRHLLARQGAFKYNIPLNKCAALPQNVFVLQSQQQELDEADHLQVNILPKRFCIASSCFCPSVRVCLQQSLYVRFLRHACLSSCAAVSISPLTMSPTMLRTTDTLCAIYVLLCQELQQDAK